MEMFFTADWHLNHKNIIDYCKRPFRNVKHMNDSILNNANSRCGKNDFLWHIGDLMFAKSSQAEVYHSFKDILNTVKPYFYMIKGNHDQNNGGKNLMLYTVFIYAKTRYMLIHIPPISKDFSKLKLSENIFNNIDCILCGHVHGTWLSSVYKTYHQIPIINVGVDVWKFKPVKIVDINNLYNKIKKEII